MDRFRGKTDEEVKNAIITDPSAIDELIRRYERKTLFELNALSKSGDNTAYIVLLKRRAGSNQFDSAIRGGTVTMRDPALLSLIKTPFDPFFENHFASTRRCSL